MQPNPIHLNSVSLAPWNMKVIDEFEQQTWRCLRRLSDAWAQGDTEAIRSILDWLRELATQFNAQSLADLCEEKESHFFNGCINYEELEKLYHCFFETWMQKMGFPVEEPLP